MTERYIGLQRVTDKQMASTYNTGTRVNLLHAATGVLKVSLALDDVRVRFT